MSTQADAEIPEHIRLQHRAVDLYAEYIFPMKDVKAAIREALEPPKVWKRVWIRPDGAVDSDPRGTDPAMSAEFMAHVKGWAMGDMVATWGVAPVDGFDLIVRLNVKYGWTLDTQTATSATLWRLA